MAMSTMEDVVSYLNKTKSSLQNKTYAYQDFLQTILDFKAGRINTARLVAKLKELFRGHENLIIGFNAFLPKEYKIVPTEDHEAALGFVNKVRTVFRDNHVVFTAFLHALDMYSNRKKSIIEVYQEVAFLFRGHHELLLEFRKFLPDTSSISTPLDITHAEKKRRIEKKSAEKGEDGGDRVFFDRVKAAFCNTDIQQQLMKCMELYSNEIITRPELQELVDDLIGEYPVLVEGFDEFLEHVEKTRKSDATCSGKSTEDSIEEFDVSKCEQVTPSYWHLPKGCVDTKSVLNEQIKCVWTGNQPFRHRHKNQYEKKMCDCEDEMFEMDMRMRPINEMVERAEKLMEKINKDIKVGKKSVFCLDDYFTDRNLRCIKQLYHDRGTETLESLRDNTTDVLPIILQKLKQKQKESAQHRKGVAQVIADNHKKLLALHKRLCGKDLREIQ